MSEQTKVKHLIGGPFSGAEVNRGSASLLLSGPGVPDEQVARYRYSRKVDAYVFKGLDTIVAHIPAPSTPEQED